MSYAEKIAAARAEAGLITINYSLDIRQVAETMRECGTFLLIEDGKCVKLEVEEVEKE